MNPFVTTGYAGAEYFCDRVEETKALKDLLLNGNNVALMSPRRFGKTDLIRHCFAQKEISEKFHTFIIDIYSTKIQKFYDFFAAFIFFSQKKGIQCLKTGKKPSDYYKRL